MTRTYLPPALLTLMLAFSGPGYAQTAAPNLAIAGPPDVVVLVVQQAGSADTVSLTYAGKVPHARALADCAALITAGGWQASRPAVRDAAGPMKNRAAALTGASFQALGAVGTGPQTLPVAAIAHALHGYKRLAAVFFTGPQLVFQGPLSSADNDIKIALDQHGTTFAYQIEIVNPNFGALPPVQASGTAQAPPRSRWPIVLGILSVALAAGLLVYILTSRLTASAAPDDDPNHTEIPEEIEAKR